MASKVDGHCHPCQSSAPTPRRQHGATAERVACHHRRKERAPPPQSRGRSRVPPAELCGDLLGRHQLVLVGEQCWKRVESGASSWRREASRIGPWSVNSAHVELVDQGGHDRVGDECLGPAAAELESVDAAVNGRRGLGPAGVLVEVAALRCSVEPVAQITPSTCCGARRAASPSAWRRTAGSNRATTPPRSHAITSGSAASRRGQASGRTCGRSPAYARLRRSRGHGGERSRPCCPRRSLQP